MLAIAVGGLASASMLFGIKLRMEPFFQIITPDQRKKLIAANMLLLLVYAILAMGSLYIWGFSYELIHVASFPFATASAAINMVVIRGRVKEHLFVFGLVLSINYLLLEFAMFLVDRWMGLHDLLGLLYAVIGYLVLLLLTHPATQWLLNISVKPFLDLENGSYWKTVWFIPTALFITILLLPEGGQADSASVLLCRFMIGMVLILTCLSIAPDHKRLREREVINQQLLDQQFHYAGLQMKVEEARKTQHDLKHHIEVIRHYIETGDQEGLRRYCDELYTRNQEQIPILYTGNAAVDGILSRYMQLAQEEGISFAYRGTIRSNGIADIDLCVLLGNALDNALAACRTAREKSILVSARSEHQVLTIMVQNTFDGIVQTEGNKILSRKREHAPGVGVSSMREICKRCGGSMDLHWDETAFTAMFVLPLK